MNRTRRAAATLPLVAGLALSALAARAQQGATLADLSLEQLSNLQVTSVGKRVQRLADVAGSVYVIRNEDIRRSGAVTLPEALRLAPNLQVARADAAQYAISARSGSDLLANKMLVLVDGRTVYSPLFSGVFWEALDVMLEDVERIEVLSGSGGTLYGANAFNGVINIITKSAAETQGALAKVVGGTQDQTLAARYGGAAGPVNFRLWAKRTLSDHTQRANGTPLRDDAQRSQAGFRADSAGEQHQWTVQGDVFRQESLEAAPSLRRYSGFNLLGRYTADLQDGRKLQVQAYLDRFIREQVGTIRNTLDTLDLEVQQQSQPRAGHELVWGAGTRLQRDDAGPVTPAALSFVPLKRNMRLANVFAQDEVSLSRATKLTFGAKAEHNSYTGWEFLPNLRFAWETSSEHLLWAAASRVVRSPARVDRDAFSPPLRPSPGFDSEVARVFELGWRARPAAGLSMSATLFHHDFSNLRSFDLDGAGIGSFGNNYRGRLNGVETWGEWQAGRNWRLQASYVYQRPHYDAASGTAPFPASTTLGNDARYQAMLSSAWTLAPDMDVDLRVRRVGARPAPAVPAYTSLDARWAWRPRRQWEVSATVTNLGGSHAEWGSPATRSVFGRAVYLQLTWRL
jgi:iron complex outermembrane receptor protein